MDNIRIFETYLPVFPGFYNTIFDGSHLIEIYYENINDDRRFLRLPKIDGLDLEFDWNGYRLNVSENLCDILQYHLRDFVENIELQSISSPKYYNYSNDSINCKITLDVYKLSQFIKDNWDDFEIYIKDNYTSRDGFMSYKDNNANEWLEKTNGFIDNLDGHELGSLLQFICELLDINESKLYYDLDVYLDCINSEFETYKIECPECGEWFMDKDIINLWNNQINNILNQSIIRDFNEWLKNYKINCGCI